MFVRVQSPAAASAASKCSLMPNKVRVVSPAGVRLVPSATGEAGGMG
jgi:hypothetical protein